jgi:hypothetical protein
LSNPRWGSARALRLCQLETSSECNEAAAAVEAAVALALVSEAEGNEVLVLLDRLSAMLTKLGGFAR